MLAVTGGSYALIRYQSVNKAESTVIEETGKEPVDLKSANINESGGFGKSITEVPKLVPKNEITLNILNPADNSIVTSPTLKVSGTTLPGAEVFINEVETKADSKGQFSANITLEEDDNYIVVVANDEFGNTAEAELTVSYQTP